MPLLALSPPGFPLKSTKRRINWLKPEQKQKIRLPLTRTEGMFQNSGSGLTEEKTLDLRKEYFEPGSPGLIPGLSQ